MSTKFNVIYSREKSWIVARCLEIDVVSQGRTMKSAEKNIKEAIELYLESFGSPDIPELKSKPTIKTVSLSNYAKTISGVRKRTDSVLGARRVRKAASKRKPRVPAKANA